jgi:hypothetical protein
MMLELLRIKSCQTMEVDDPALLRKQFDFHAEPDRPVVEIWSLTQSINCLYSIVNQEINNITRLVTKETSQNSFLPLGR